MADRAFAENRFGLGPRGDGGAAAGDPRGWAAVQLKGFQAQLADVPSRRVVAEELADYLATSARRGLSGVRMARRR